MEIGNAVIMVPDILPDSHCMGLFTVKGSVYEFYLGHFRLKEPLQFRQYQIQAAKTQFPINGRQTVGTGKRTSSAAFVVDNAVFQFFHIHKSIGKWDLAHVHYLAKTCICKCAISISHHKTGNLF